jgi:structural maintenance of chromosome 2
MYILDEVDAALDLSHTQNIGLMLRTHFSGSQFIVVSLKEGMFNNANVIYRTKFVDGVSTVMRNTANSKSKPLAVSDGNSVKEKSSGPAKKKSRATVNGIENTNVL